MSDTVKVNMYPTDPRAVLLCLERQGWTTLQIDSIECQMSPFGNKMWYLLKVNSSMPSEPLSRLQGGLVRMRGEQEMGAP